MINDKTRLAREIFGSKKTYETKKATAVATSASTNGEVEIDLGSGQTITAKALASVSAGDEISVLINDGAVFVLGKSGWGDDVNENIDDASKTATNFLSFESGTGLIVGNLQDSELGANTLISADGYAIRQGDYEMASFRAYQNGNTTWTDLSSQGQLRISAGTADSPSPVFLSAPSASGAQSDIGVGLTPIATGDAQNPYKYKFLAMPDEIEFYGSPATLNGSPILTRQNQLSFLKVYEDSVTATVPSTSGSWVTRPYSNPQSLAINANGIMSQNGSYLQIEKDGYYKLSCGCRLNPSSNVTVGFSIYSAVTTGGLSTLRTCLAFDYVQNNPYFFYIGSQVYYLNAGMQFLPSYNLTANVNLVGNNKEQYTFMSAEYLGDA